MMETKIINHDEEQFFYVKNCQILFSVLKNNFTKNSVLNLFRFSAFTTIRSIRSIRSITFNKILFVIKNIFSSLDIE